MVMGVTFFALSVALEVDSKFKGELRIESGKWRMNAAVDGYRLIKLVSFERNGGMGSYPRAPSLALRAIHLVPPYMIQFVNGSTYIP